jgi:hypothetical protein
LAGVVSDLFSSLFFRWEEIEMVEQSAPRARYGEAFWRAHHEAWKRSDLNQRVYCESQGISLKAFGNWRAKFKAEPEAPQRKLLYRRGGAGHRRRFSDADRCHILAEAARPGASVSEVARRYGIDRRVLFRWRQEHTASPVFVDVEIVDGSDADREVTP